MAKDRKSETTVKGEATYMRGARSFLQGRFETVAREVFDDGWTPEEKDERPLQTQVTIERARSIISHNDSPDVGFDSSINPYRGCEHGCIYCYARPSHSYLELSPGLDFETKLFAKTNAAELLRAELAKPGYKPSPIALGANTDCYQPIERKYRITRQILEVLAECNHPVTMVTKSALVERDLDLLGPMAEKNLVRVFVSIGTLEYRRQARNRRHFRLVEPAITVAIELLERAVRRARDRRLPRDAGPFGRGARGLECNAGDRQRRGYGDPDGAHVHHEKGSPGLVAGRQMHVLDRSHLCATDPARRVPARE